MKLLYIGSEQNRDELAAKFAPTNQIDYEYELENLGGELGAYAAVFDFDLMTNSERLIRYGESQLIVFANSVLSSLSQIVSDQDPVPFLIGFNGLPTFINRDHLEVTLLPPGQSKERVAQICADLDTNHLLVEDRVGMVSTRVVCMIINDRLLHF